MDTEAIKFGTKSNWNKLSLNEGITNVLGINIRTSR